jgi:hypothetical protein
MSQGSYDLPCCKKIQEVQVAHIILALEVLKLQVLFFLFVTFSRATDFDDWPPEKVIIFSSLALLAKKSQQLPGFLVVR